MAEISWDEEMIFCYGIASLTEKEFIQKARQEHIQNTGEDLPEDTVVGRNQFKSWVMKVNP